MSNFVLERGRELFSIQCIEHMLGDEQAGAQSANDGNDGKRFFQIISGQFIRGYVDARQRDGLASPQPIAQDKPASVPGSHTLKHSVRQQQGSERGEQAQGPSDAFGGAAWLQDKVRGNHKRQNAERRSAGGQYPQQEEKGCARTRCGSFLHEAENKIYASREAGIQQKEAGQRERCSQGEVHAYSSSRE